ncbi:MAG: DMT family transporter [Limnochordales bacterium]|nr:DMT family transporter [Limnochordales bacterium]
MSRSWVIALILASLAGALMPLQGAANSWLARRTGLALATFWVHATGMVIVSLVLLFLPSTRGSGSWRELLHAPLPALLGGLLGVGITWLVAASVPALGMVAATTGILVAQIATAMLLDHFGLLGLDRISFSWTRGLGALLLAIGAWLLLRR